MLRRFLLVVITVAIVPSCSDGGKQDPVRVDADGDGYTAEEGDCDDSDASLKPEDADSDGYSTCDDDCDDTDASLNPKDEDADGYSTCDGDCDDTDATLNLEDSDGDAASSCDGDCDDSDASLNLKDEDGDGADTCEGDCDDTDASLNLDDADEDGFTTCDGDCDDQDGWLTPADNDTDGLSTCEGDCDDSDAALNLKDEDADGYTTCDGDCDDSSAGLNLDDADSDGFSTCEGDCDDGAEEINPGVVEICWDLVDNDCDGQTDCAYTKKIDEIPDYLQVDLAYGGFPGAGAQYCGPVATSNPLMWLDDHGYDEIISDSADRKEDQHDLIEALGSPTYMDTSTDNGTSPYRLLLGLDDYLRDAGLSGYSLLYQGWRTVLPEYHTGMETVDLQWIKREVEGNTAVILNVGWYNYDSGTDTYTRDGGHWVTLVGYHHDGTSYNPDFLVLHDPSPLAGLSFANEYVRLEPIESGTVQNGAARSAAGLYKLTDGMHMRLTIDYGILEGAVLLRMP